MFFSFLTVFPLPESYQNDPKFHFNTLLCSDTQKSSKNVENTTVFWSRCETAFGPRPPAKADIATAILTNVIEHLVLLFCPPISTPSPPKRCGRIYPHVFCNKGSKSFQNIAFDSVFVMFPVKHTVIYTFFAITSVQNTCFCSVFNALASKNPAKSCYVQCFFSFLAVFPLPESSQNDPKFHFNTPLRSDTQKSSKNVENTTVFWSRCETVFGPPPAKADIATAILTNVIEHLVLLFCPPISTPSPPKRCGRIYIYNIYLFSFASVQGLLAWVESCMVPATLEQQSCTTMLSTIAHAWHALRSAFSPFDCGASL